MPRAKSKRYQHALLAAGVLLSGYLAAWAFGAQADTKKTPLQVTVDPRIELVSLIFRLAGNPEYNRCRVEGYARDADEHFQPFKDHAIVKLARELRNQRGVSYDAPMSMAIHLTDAEKLEGKVPFDPHPDDLDGRWPPAGARKFLQQGRQFAAESHFQEFFADHQSLYQTAESRLKKLLEKNAHLEWFDEFFGARPQANFTVALGMFNGGNCYGPHCRLLDGKEELYCILGVWKTDGQGLPDFDAKVVDTVVHEFCHSYANPIIDRHEAELQEAGEKIHPRVAAALRRQNYGNWKTMMYESLVRACSVRYVRRFGDAKAYQAAIQQEKQRQFLWIEDLSNLLGEYESQRDRYATLEDFAPQIVQFFHDYAAKMTK